MAEDEEEKEEKHWDDYNQALETITSSGDYQWMKVIKALSKEDKKQFISLKKYRQRFNIKSQNQLNDLIENVLKMAGEVNWEIELSDKEVGKLESTRQDLEKLKSRTKEQKKKYEDTITRLLEKVGRLREKQLSYNVPKFEKDLKEFKKLLDGTHENTIQQWLAERPWFFGPNYLEQKPEVLLVDEGRLDFLLKRYDTFYDIVELKLPVDKLFSVSNKKREKLKEEGDLFFGFSREVTISPKLKDAVMQVIGYIESYEEHKGGIFSSRGKLFHKPQGTIIIGKLSKENKRNDEKLMKTLNSYLRDIEILTYDQFYETARNFVNLIKKRKKK